MIAIFYAFLTSFGTLVGGLLPNLAFFKKLDSRYLVGFAAGAMLSISFFDILPELDSDAMVWVAIGFFTIFLVEKFIIIHTHHEAECTHQSLGWPAMIGVAAESIVDGVAIAVGYSVAPALGLSVAIAVIAHELPRGFTTTMVMKNAGKGTAAIAGALLIDAGLTPIGALIGTLLPDAYFMAILGFTAGTFLYVGAVDLLPEIHKRFNWKVIFSVMFGVTVIYGISKFL
jgi:zinc transporter ZupT